MKSWNGQIRVKAGEEESVRSKKRGTGEEGRWTSEEGSSCAGGFEEDLGFTGAHHARNRYEAGKKGGICHRKVCFGGTEK